MSTTSPIIQSCLGYTRAGLINKERRNEIKTRIVCVSAGRVTGIRLVAESNNTPTPAHTVSHTATTDQVWNKVSSSGKLVFGSSMDYAPFESYDKSFEPTGFDIALGREIGARLGLQVEFKDMAFESVLPRN